MRKEWWLMLVIILVLSNTCFAKEPANAIKITDCFIMLDKQSNITLYYTNETIQQIQSGMYKIEANLKHVVFDVVRTEDKNSYIKVSHSGITILLGKDFSYKLLFIDGKDKI
jgi:hypothetical protein